MSEKFPWGAEAPARRAIRLRSSLGKLEKRLEKLVADFEAARGVLDKEISEIQAALVAVDDYVAAKRRQAMSAAFARAAEKLVASGKIDFESLNDPDFVEGLLSKALAGD